MSSFILHDNSVAVRRAKAYDQIRSGRMLLLPILQSEDREPDAISSPASIRPGPVQGSVAIVVHRLPICPRFKQLLDDDNISPLGSFLHSHGVIAERARGRKGAKLAGIERGIQRTRTAAGVVGKIRCMYCVP